MTYNLQLLRKERDWVTEQRALPYAESQLEMDYWYVEVSEEGELAGKTCGTAYCVAGHIAATTPGVVWMGGSFIGVNGQERDISAWAREQLGISPNEAWHLFYTQNDEVLDELDALIALAEAEERDAA